MFTGARNHPLMQTFACLMESLEHRLCMSATPLSGAMQVQFDTTDHSLAGILSNANRDDVFKFRMDKAGTVNLKLTGLTGDATLQLVQDRNNNNRIDNGEVIMESKNAGTANESISRLLEGGNYAICVAQANSGQNAKYTLTYSKSLFSTPDKVDTVGDDESKAKILDSKASNQTLVEHIGGSDAADWYKLDLKSAKKVNVRLNGLVFDADMTIAIDKNKNGKVDAGETIATTQGKALSEKVFEAKLNAGTYLFSVKAVKAAEATTYALRVA